MQMKLTGYLIVALLITGMLSACGFHLRGSVALPQGLQSTAVQGVTEYSELDLALKRAFRHGGYPLTTLENAATTLKVNKNSFSRRVLSVNSAGNPNEYELSYFLQFELLDKNKQEILPQQTISLFRSYRYNPDVRLAKEAEENRLQKNMVNDAVKQLIRRISIAMKK
jgi:LPS-assembly lipoprotein